MTMKIRPGEDVAAQIAGVRQGQSAKPGAFQKVLDRAIGGSSRAPEGTAISPLLEVDEVRARLRADDAAPVIDRLDRFLDLLESYQQKLANPAIPAAELDKTIGMLEGQIGELAKAMEDLPEGDGVREIMNRALVATTVEIAKFRRGDYV